jgi:starch synthase
MQVYFIDNEEYFKRKAVFTDEDDRLFSDNDERAIFFAKGVVETVKKLNWAPDIIHVHGWMASMLPVYLKEYYKEEPLFTESKIVTSLYNGGFEGNLNEDFVKVAHLQTPNYVNILKCAIENSDAVVHGSETIPIELSKFLETQKVPVLEYGLENQRDAYLKFYADLLSV